MYESGKKELLQSEPYPSRYGYRFTAISEIGGRSNWSPSHFQRDQIRLADRQRDDSQGWIDRRTGRELRTVGYEQIGDVVGLAPFVDDTK